MSLYNDWDYINTLEAWHDRRSYAPTQDDATFKDTWNSLFLCDSPISKSSTPTATGSPPKAQEHSASNTARNPSPEHLDPSLPLTPVYWDLDRDEELTLKTLPQGSLLEISPKTTYLKKTLSSYSSTQEEYKSSSDSAKLNPEKISDPMFKSRSSGDVLALAKLDMLTPINHTSSSAPIATIYGGMVTTAKKRSSSTISTAGVNTRFSSAYWTFTPLGLIQKAVPHTLVGIKCSSQATSTLETGTRVSRGKRTSHFNDEFTKSGTSNRLSSDTPGTAKKLKYTWSLTNNSRK